MRYHAQNIVTGAWVSRDLPLTGPELTWDLSGPSAFTATLTRGFAGMVDLVEWQTAIYPEESGQIRGGFLLTGADPQPDSLELTGIGFAGYPQGMIWDSDYQSPVPKGVDPADVVRLIWKHLQSQPDGNLHMNVTGSTTVLLNNTVIKRWTNQGWVTFPEPDSVLAALFKLIPESGTVTGWLGNWPSSQFKGAPDNAQTGDRWYPYPGSTTAAVSVYNGTAWKQHARDAIDQVFTDLAGPLGATHVSQLSRPLAFSDTETTPEHGNDLWFDISRYELRWWNSTDCGQEIDSLAGETPFDYLERHYWAKDGSDSVTHEITIGSPALGTRRNDLRFVLGENLSAAPQPEHNTDYANLVIALGAGEGAVMLRTTAGRRDGRLRRTAVLAEKDVRDLRRLATDADQQLTRSQALAELSEVDVWEHPNAPLGAIGPGDEIRIQADLGWSELDVWRRITSITEHPDSGDAMQLKLTEVV